MLWSEFVSMACSEEIPSSKNSVICMNIPPGSDRISSILDSEDMNSFSAMIVGAVKNIILATVTMMDAPVTDARSHNI